ncbi:hypothetical protein P4377_26410 [Bacillus thuringiensis]|nr:hypothetical protein [Bacillus thuringiensis]
MKIHFVFVVATSKHQTKPKFNIMMKTFESTIRPVEGDIIDDPGFDTGFHNGYEVGKVTINYAEKECYVSLSPLVATRETIQMETYIEKLKRHGWRTLTKEELLTPTFER